MAAFRHVEAVEVLLGGKTVGALARVPGVQRYAFQYHPAWLRNAYSISPLFLPLGSDPISFPGISKDTWHELPPAIADALPDRFGNGLINARLAELGVSPDMISPLDRLSYVADRAMGALEFRPAHSLGRVKEGILDIAELVDTARAAIEGSITSEHSAGAALRHLLSVGTSAGGARAKAVVNIDPDTGAITSGQRPEAGKESWLLKFDGVGADDGLGASQAYGRIEYAYSMMARDAGIDIPAAKLFEENGRAHFMIRRFDRDDTASEGKPAKIHMQSLCAMGMVDFNLVRTHDYASLLAVIDRLDLGEEAAAEAFRRMVFNYMAMNCDDHSKNFAFLMDDTGTWRLAPAYDMTFAYNSQNIWLREHLMGVDGKFADLSEKDMKAFAARRGIPGAAGIIKDVRSAIDNWTDYAARAGMSAAESEEVKKALRSGPASPAGPAPQSLVLHVRRSKGRRSRRLPG